MSDQVGQPRRVGVQHPHDGPHTESDLRRLGAGDPAADDQNLGRRGAGHAAQQQPGPAGRALQVMRRGLHGHAARDLAHRGEQRQLAVGGLHRLVGDGVDPFVHQELGERLVRGQVQVGEQLLALAEPVVLRGDRLLDLDDQVGPGEHLVRAGHDLGPGRGELGVREARTGPGVRLHQHLVPGVHQLGHAVRLHRHPVLVVLDLLGHSDDQIGHESAPFTSRSPPVRRARSHHRIALTGRADPDGSVHQHSTIQGSVYGTAR